MGTKKNSKIKVNKKRLSLVIAILAVAIILVIGILSLILRAFSPEKPFGNYSNNNAGLAIADGNTVYYNKYESGIFKVKGKKETKLTDETAYSITLVKNTLYYLTISESNTIDLKKVDTNGENNEKITTLSTPMSKFYIEDHEYKIKEGEFEVYPFPSYLHKLTGVGGVLYPPHILDQNVLDEEKCRKLAPTNDDIWFWLMAVLNGAKINVVKNNIPRIEAIKGTQEGECLNKINDSGEGLLWKDFHRLLGEYPQLDDILRNEYKTMQNMM